MTKNISYRLAVKALRAEINCLFTALSALSLMPVLSSWARFSSIISLIFIENLFLAPDWLPSGSAVECLSGTCLWGRGRGGVVYFLSLAPTVSQGAGLGFVWEILCVVKSGAGPLKYSSIHWSYWDLRKEWKLTFLICSSSQFLFFFFLFFLRSLTSAWGRVRIRTSKL